MGPWTVFLFLCLLWQFLSLSQKLQMFLSCCLRSGNREREVLSVSRAALWDGLLSYTLQIVSLGGEGALWRSLLLLLERSQCIKACGPAVCADSTCLKQPGVTGTTCMRTQHYPSLLLLTLPPLLNIWPSWGQDLSPAKLKKGKVTRGFLTASLFIPEPRYCNGYNFLLPTSDTTAEWLLEWLVMKWSEAIWEQFWTLLFMDFNILFQWTSGLASPFSCMWDAVHHTSRSECLSLSCHLHGFYYDQALCLNWADRTVLFGTEWQQLFLFIARESCTFLLVSC